MRLSGPSSGLLLLWITGSACGGSSRPPVFALDATIDPDTGPTPDTGSPSPHDASHDASDARVGDGSAGDVVTADTGAVDAADGATGDSAVVPGDGSSDGGCDSCQAFNPTANPTYLAGGLYRFTSVRIPAGVTVMIDPSSTSALLDLQVSGDVVIEGTIDLSGGPGSASSLAIGSTSQGRAGTGGVTGAPRTAPAGPGCAFIAGAGGTGGTGAFSDVGTCMAGSSTACIASPFVFAAPFARAGGGGVFTGLRAYGSGGGGPAGGGAGALEPVPEATAAMGALDCMGVLAGGGAAVGRGGSSGVPAYDGEDGNTGRSQCPGSSGVPAAFLGGGGGGSIGAAAAADLAVATTFVPGSGGGGGSADYSFRPGAGGTSGGGGGGGALRIVSTTSITVSGSLLANGGPGGNAFVGSGMAEGCDPQPGAAGGGGSGGVIFLRAPMITTTATARVSAIGGLGRLASPYATGGRSGAGGLGRIRLSVPTAACALGGTFAPPLASGCAPSSAAGSTYVAAYPD